MTGYELLKTLHVLSAMLWVGGGAFYAIVYHYLSRRLDRRELFAVIEHIDRFGGPFFIGSGLATLVFGAWNVATSEVWSFSDAWIALGLAGLLVAFVLGGVAGVPLTQRLYRLVESGTEAEVGSLLRTIIVINYVEMLLLAAVVFDMVAKPGT
jgi:uncharacterized membrane protein